MLKGSTLLHPKQEEALPILPIFMLNMQKPASWRQIQRENFTRMNELADFLELDECARAQLLQPASFVLNLPRRLASKIRKNDLSDPIARQFIPTCQELEKGFLFEKDPVQDTEFRLTDRLLQKYPGRALLVTTGACAMHCRYCFRQNYEYPTGGAFDKELSILKERQDIEEVILSGGDPLSLSDEKLFGLLDKLSKISHIKRFRLHTRFPIGIPERLDESFLLQFSKLNTPVWVVLHTNHANELDEEVLSALKCWQRAGAILLNQSVLLKGVNDSLEVLKELCQTLINNGILPYYLHQLDKVEGASHHEVDPQKGLEIVDQLRKELSGYGVPLYVQEIPHESSKTPLTQERLPVIQVEPHIRLTSRSPKSSIDFPSISSTF